jgi:hypothetical protein
MKYVYLLAACILWLWWRNYESPHVPYRCDAGQEPVLEELPIPAVFEDWIAKHLRGNK